jgi:hypothetical protein
MQFLTTYAKEIISIAVPIVLWILNRIVEAPAKLVQGIRHAFTFLLQEPTYD